MVTTVGGKPLTLEELHQINVLTDRVKKRRQEYLDAKPMLASERNKIFTEAWKETEGENIAIRYAKAFKRVMEEIPIFIKEGELIIGSYTKYVRGCYPSVEWLAESIIEDLSQEEFTISHESFYGKTTEEDRKINLECAEYWKDKSMTAKTSKLYHALWGNLIDDCEETRLFNLGFRSPLSTRPLDFEKVINKGLRGVVQEAKEELEKLTLKTKEELEKWYFVNAAIISMEAAIHFARRHAALAWEMAQREKDPVRKGELEKIAQMCEWVPENPARSFHEALQSIWLVWLASRLETVAGAETPGRFDQYMYPFYERDLLDGRITRQDAAELLGLLWTKIVELLRYKERFIKILSQGSEFVNVTLGGVTKDGRDATNELSYLVLEVERQVRYNDPYISVRWHDGMSEDFLIQAIECNKAVRGGIPQFLNDRAGILTMCAEGIPLVEAREWIPIGCVGKKIATSSASFTNPWANFGKCLELALNDGIDPRSGKQLGLKTGDPRTFTSMEQLEEALKKQTEHVFKLTTDAYNIFINVRRENYRMPFSSALMNDCLKKGLDAGAGGFRWNNLTCKLVPVGHVNVADSLTAIRKLVFEEKKLTMGQVLQAIKDDFEGHEEVRRMLLSAPKYGNDNDYADEAMVKVHAWTEAIVFGFKTAWGDQWMISRQGNASHQLYGSRTGALPDGKKAWEPFADGTLSPMRGVDTKGPTAVFNSAAKPDCSLSDGTVLNQKIHPTVLQGRDGIRKLLSLIKTYFDRGGYHVQLNIVDPQTLIEAKKHPERYRDLVVRVGGFSAYFVELSPEVQDEIIARTTQML